MKNLKNAWGLRNSATANTWIPTFYNQCHHICLIYLYVYFISHLKVCHRHFITYYFSLCLLRVRTFWTTVPLSQLKKFTVSSNPLHIQISPSIPRMSFTYYRIYMQAIKMPASRMTATPVYQWMWDEKVAFFSARQSRLDSFCSSCFGERLEAVCLLAARRVGKFLFLCS